MSKAAGGEIPRWDAVYGRGTPNVGGWLSPGRSATHAEVAQGVTLDDLTWGKRCADCHGEGWTNPLPELPREECPGCGGWGRIAHQP